MLLVEEEEMGEDVDIAYCPKVEISVVNCLNQGAIRIKAPIFKFRIAHFQQKSKLRHTVN